MAKETKDTIFEAMRDQISLIKSAAHELEVLAIALELNTATEENDDDEVCRLCRYVNSHIRIVETPDGKQRVQAV